MTAQERIQRMLGQLFIENATLMEQNEALVEDIKALTLKQAQSDDHEDTSSEG